MEIILYGMDKCEFGDVNYQDTVGDHDFYDTSITIGETSNGNALSVNLQTNMYFDGREPDSYIEYCDFRVDGNGCQDNASDKTKEIIERFYNMVSVEYVKQLTNVVVQMINKGGDKMIKYSFEIEHPSGDTYMCFELAIDSSGKIKISHTENCSLADIDGDYIFDTDNDLYRIQADWFTYPDNYKEMTERFERSCEENGVNVKYY